MTTNNVTPREAITEQLDSVLALHKFGEDIVPMSVTERQADAVIAELWRMADDPEVTDLVDDIVSIHGMSRTESRGIVDDVVAALIGERPESEATE